MNRKAWLAVISGLAVLGCSGCYATFWEKWTGPRSNTSETKLTTCDGPGNVYKRVGTGKWTDEQGVTRQQPVYIRVDETGPKGERGDRGPRGEVIVEVTPDRSTFDANAGVYERKVAEPRGPSWWVGSPGKTTVEIAPFRQDTGSLPAYKSPSGASISKGSKSSVTGGGFSVIEEEIGKSWLVLVVLGGILVAGGVFVGIYTGRWVLSLAIMGAGGAMIVSGLYPWVFLIALVLFTVGLVWWFLDAKGLLKVKATLADTADALASKTTALTAIVKGVEKTPAEVQAVVKPAIADAAGSDAADVKATISAAKAEAGV